MTIRTRLVALSLSVLTLFVCTRLPLLAQEPSSTPPAESAKAEPKTSPQYRRVPSYFGQLGLSTPQREQIYTLRGQYQAEVQELNRRILELKEQEMAECEAVLTEAQKKLLDQRRAASKGQTAPVR